MYESSQFSIGQVFKKVCVWQGFCRVTSVCHSATQHWTVLYMTTCISQTLAFVLKRHPIEHIQKTLMIIVIIHIPFLLTYNDICQFSSQLPQIFHWKMHFCSDLLKLLKTAIVGVKFQCTYTESMEQSKDIV